MARKWRPGLAFVLFGALAGTLALSFVGLVVLRYSGRLYLAKDARMSATMFRAGYPRWAEFCELRRAWGADRALHSLMSRRLEI